MADEKINGPADDTPANETEVRRLHVIYHVVADTNQLIKIEQLDEETGRTREVPLPVLVSFSEATEEAASDESIATPPFKGIAFSEMLTKKKQGVPNPKAGPLMFMAATKGIPPPKAGPPKFVPNEEEEDV